jgi:ubiquinone biosynthesis protein UbiJ
LDAQEKRRRLAKRLKDMTDSIEALSSQVYQLQQRIELLEKKTQKEDITQYE